MGSPRRRRDRCRRSTDVISTTPANPDAPQGVDAATARCYPHEFQRIALICARDGLAAAVDFCARTSRIYRDAVLASGRRGHHHAHFASLPEYRRKFIGSYLDFKRFYLRHRMRAADDRVTTDGSL